MAKNFAEIVTELKARLDAYIADPASQSEEAIQQLIQELDWARNPGEHTGEPSSPHRQDDTPDTTDNETSSSS